MTRTATQKTFDFEAARYAAAFDLLPNWVKRFRWNFEARVDHFDFYGYARTIKGSAYANNSRPVGAER